MGAKDADWVSIKAEYLAGSSFGKLSKKYGVDKGTIYRRSQKENWNGICNAVAIETQRKTIEKISDKLSDDEAEIASLKKETRLLLWRVTKQRIGMIDEDTASSDIRRYVQNYVDLLAVDPDNGIEETESSGLIDALNADTDIFDIGDDSDFLPEESE